MVTYFQSKDLKTQFFGIGNYLDFKERASVSGRGGPWMPYASYRCKGIIH